MKHISFREAKNRILSVDDRFCTEILLKNLLANAPTPDEMGKLTVFLKTAPEEDIQNLSKSDSFCAEVKVTFINKNEKKTNEIIFYKLKKKLLTLFHHNNNKTKIDHDDSSIQGTNRYYAF